VVPVTGAYRSGSRQGSVGSDDSSRQLGVLAELQNYSGDWDSELRPTEEVLTTGREQRWFCGRLSMAAHGWQTTSTNGSH
jgi:hypothetical protein